MIKTERSREVKTGFVVMNLVKPVQDDRGGYGPRKRELWW
jgi:hypothetical protein